VKPASASIRRAVCSPHAVPRTRGSVILRDPAGRHGTEPFAHVTLVERGTGCDLGARSRAFPHRLEQSGLVPDVDHQRQDAAGVDPKIRRAKSCTRLRSRGWSILATQNSSAKEATSARRLDGVNPRVAGRR
jgi:hypothetical protein